MRTALLLVLLALTALGVVLLPEPQRPATANPLTGVTAVGAGWAHTCALTEDGGIKCWGDNISGQLGDAQKCGFSSCAAPVDVIGLTTGVAAVAAGGSDACALTTTGGVKCWGRNSYGQLGDGTTMDRTTPVDVVGLTTDVAAVAVGGEHTCAVTTQAGVKCWGLNLRGELGTQTTELCGPSFPCSSVAEDVLGLASGAAAVDVSSGAVGGHTCAVTTMGGVKCWGLNVDGQLGDGQNCGTLVCNTPVDVAGLTSGRYTSQPPCRTQRRHPRQQGAGACRRHPCEQVLELDP